MRLFRQKSPTDKKTLASFGFEGGAPGFAEVRASSWPLALSLHSRTHFNAGMVGGSFVPVRPARRGPRQGTHLEEW